MTPVRKYKSLWETIAAQIPGITKVIMVDDEPGLANKIKDIDAASLFLVVVTPSSDLNPENEDNYGDIETCVIYLLIKVNPGDQTEEDIMDERELTQGTMKEIREQMAQYAGMCDGSDASVILKQFMRGKQHVDRERNYLGCNGYSLSFGIKTNGF